MAEDGVMAIWIKAEWLLETSWITVSPVVNAQGMQPA